MKEINGFKVHPIGIGTWEMGGGSSQNSRYDARDIRAIKYSISKGQNHIDTAESYGDGHTEELVGEAIKGTDRSKLFIASKVWKTNCTKENMRPAVEGMLTRLGTDYLDLLYIHTPRSHAKMEEFMPALSSMIDAGLTKAIGLSNFNLPQLQMAVGLSNHPISALQNQYSLLYQKGVTTDLMEYCRNHKIAVVAYRPVERGMVAYNQVIKNMAESKLATPAQIAISWLIAQEGVHAIPKASSIKHIDENLGALSIKLNDLEIKRLTKN